MSSSSMAAAGTSHGAAERKSSDSASSAPVSAAPKAPHGGWRRGGAAAGGSAHADSSSGPSGGGKASKRPRMTDETPEERERTRVSKTLSWMLRHHAAECGLSVRADGFAPVAQVLAHAKLRGVPIAMLEDIVAKCPKQRFSFGVDEATGERLIRANQGHSGATAAALDDEAMMTRVTDAATLPICVHGTYHSHWASIKAGGLKRMSRRHVHFAAGELGDAAVKSGMRSSAHIHVYLDVPKALEAGLVLWRSANNVILTSGLGEEGVIPMALIARAIDSRTKEVLWPEPSAGSAAAAGAGGASAAGAAAGGAGAGDASAAAAGGAGGPSAPATAAAASAEPGSA